MSVMSAVNQQLCIHTCTNAVLTTAHTLCFSNSVLLLLTSKLRPKKIEREVICIDIASDRMRTEKYYITGYTFRLYTCIHEILM